MLVDWENFNYLPVILGGIAYMVYGGIYYSVILSNKKKSNHKDILANQSNGSFKYIYSVIIAFINSYLMALLIQSTGSENVLVGMGVGFIIGLIITLVYVKNSLFGLMSKKSLLVAIGDHLVIFTLIGLIQGFFL